MEIIITLSERGGFEDRTLIRKWRRAMIILQMLLIQLQTLGRSVVF